MESGWKKSTFLQVIGINGGIGGVKIFDVSKTVSNPSSTTTDLQGTVMSFLSPDDTLDITTGNSTVQTIKLFSKKYPFAPFSRRDNHCKLEEGVAT